MNLLHEFSTLFLIVANGITFLLGYVSYRSDKTNVTKKIFFAQCLFIPIWLTVFAFSTRGDLVGEYTCCS